MNAVDAVTFWDETHAARAAAYDPQPNARLTETVTGLSPGDILDLGCGDGGDALPTSGTRARRRLPRTSTWTRRHGRSNGPTHTAGPRPAQAGTPPRSPTTSWSSAAPPDPAVRAAQGKGGGRRAHQHAPKPPP
jgi:hypothetical protein